MLLIAGCGPGPPELLPPNSLAFGVFGDGPYFFWENGRFGRVLSDAAESDVSWLIHVGDILESPCSDAVYQKRFEQLRSVPYPVVYTPGDNEWTDCHGRLQGNYDPLDREAGLRRIFFTDPHLSLGAAPMKLNPQSNRAGFNEFVENARWYAGGLVFATLHIVGSSNGLDSFDGRTSELDDEVRRRTEADLAWIDEAFEAARGMSAWGVVLAFHGDMGFLPEESSRGFEAIIDRLRVQVETFGGQVLLVHGDSHEYIVDHPLTDETGRTYESVTRLETFGSPDIGWVRVVADTLAGSFTAFEPRSMKGWW